MTVLWLQLLACPMCAQTAPSRSGWLVAAMIAVPYLVAVAVIRSVRRLE